MPINDSHWLAKPGDSLCKRRRLERRLSVVALATKVGCTHATILNWEAGRWTAYGLSVTRLLQYLGVSPAEACQSAGALKAARQRIGISPPVLARELGLTPTTIRSWERGHSWEQKRMWLRFLAQLDITPAEALEDLTGETVSPPRADSPATGQLAATAPSPV